MERVPEHGDHLLLRSGGRHSPAASSIAERLGAAFSRREAGRAARLTREEAAILWQEADLFTLGALAHQARLTLHPEGIVTYVADRNINYSNICVCACRFCAFYRPPGHAEGYVLSREELDRKIRETLALGGTQILMQGGHHPDLPLSFYEDLIGWIRKKHPDIHIHAFSPPEIIFFAQKEGLSTEEVIARLLRAGLHSIPGGGAEILADRVRSLVSPNKCTAAQWLEVMEKAHDAGIKTTATMMFGHAEEDGERLDHLFALRALQERSGGFTAFIPWTFQAANTALADRRPETTQSYLRLLALSRLVLDNVPSIQASWVTMGPQAAQLALFFGANDFGSLMIEENVVAAAGVSFRLSRAEIHGIIRKAGFIPRQRRMDYRLVDEPEQGARS
jgi:cyclic dehypoxanthinyl futalosine synthase